MLKDLSAKKLEFNETQVKKSIPLEAGTINNLTLSSFYSRLITTVTLNSAVAMKPMSRLIVVLPSLFFVGLGPASRGALTAMLP